MLQQGSVVELQPLNLDFLHNYLRKEEMRFTFMFEYLKKSNPRTK